MLNKIKKIKLFVFYLIIQTKIVIINQFNYIIFLFYSHYTYNFLNNLKSNQLKYYKIVR